MQCNYTSTCCCPVRMIFFHLVGSLLGTVTHTGRGGGGGLQVQKLQLSRIFVFFFSFSYLWIFVFFVIWLMSQAKNITESQQITTTRIIYDYNPGYTEARINVVLRSRNYFFTAPAPTLSKISAPAPAPAPATAIFCHIKLFDNSI